MQENKMKDFEFSRSNKSSIDKIYIYFYYRSQCDKFLSIKRPKIDYSFN